MGGGAKELIKHIRHGLLYKAGDLKSLISLSKDLILNGKKRMMLDEEAYQAISSSWDVL